MSENDVTNTARIAFDNTLYDDVQDIIADLEPNLEETEAVNQVADCLIDTYRSYLDASLRKYGMAADDEILEAASGFDAIDFDSLASDQLESFGYEYGPDDDYGEEYGDGDSDGEDADDEGDDDGEDEDSEEDDCEDVTP